MHLRAYGGPLDGRLINVPYSSDFYAHTDDGIKFVRWRYEVHRFARIKYTETEPVVIHVLVLCGDELPSAHRLIADHEVLN